MFPFWSFHLRKMSAEVKGYLRALRQVFKKSSESCLVWIPGKTRLGKGVCFLDDFLSLFMGFLRVFHGFSWVFSWVFLGFCRISQFCFLDDFWVKAFLSGTFWGFWKANPRFFRGDGKKGSLVSSL